MNLPDTSAIPIHLYDRSRTTTDWQCPRKRYWQYEHDGRGVVSGHTHLELYTGTTLHDGLAAMAYAHRDGKSIDINTLAGMAHKQMYDALMTLGAGEDEHDTLEFANEQATLVEGLLRGFHKHVWPRLISQFPEILYIEEEMQYEHDGIMFMSKPDLVIGKSNGSEIYYIEYKSTSSKKEDWINSWETAVQLHSTCKAIEATKKVEVNGVIVQGLYKGFASYGKQSSPFCYAYKRNGTPPFSKDETIYEYKAGFKRYPTWELDGGVSKWVNGMPDVILSEQFPQTPPIFVKEDLVNAFFAQRAVREHEIMLAGGLLKHVGEQGDKESIENIMNVAFPQKFDQCQPGWGKPCGYRKLCHGRSDNPLEQGYVYREPHHALELEQQDARKTATANAGGVSSA